jgi:hypothetical protein
MPNYISVDKAPTMINPVPDQCSTYCGDMRLSDIEDSSKNPPLVTAYHFGQVIQAECR